MNSETDFSAGFIGFGLIGGSIAKALKKSFPNCHLLAFDHHAPRNGEPVSSSLKQALSEQILDEIVTTLEPALSSCRIIFLCAPVLTNITYLKELSPLLKAGTILTDVGSVKGNIYDAVCNLGLQSQFIGGHPMTGSEKTGYANSDALLLENAYYILSPTESSHSEDFTFYQDLVSSMGSIPITLECKKHDNIVAAISHVPHVIASSLVHMVKDCDDEEKHMFSLAAGGFKDITRIASSSPIMWQNICLTNPDSILTFIDRYIESLNQIRELIHNRCETKLLDFFQAAKDYRDSVPRQTVNAPERVYELYLDIVDESGAIANISTLMAQHKINIKNIGIIHNREFQEGVLHMEFYEENAVKHSVHLLREEGYTVYER